MRHQLAHGWLVVVVAHDAAGDARGTRADGFLIDDEDVGARAAAKGFQLLRQMIGAAKAMNASADHEKLGTFRQHACTPRCANHLQP